MSTAIHRYEVPVDDRGHGIALRGRILHVGCRKPEVVEFWAFDDDGAEEDWPSFQVFGTGQPLPAGWRWVGTAVAPGGALVWHLCEFTVTVPGVDRSPAILDGAVGGMMWR